MSRQTRRQGAASEGEVHDHAPRRSSRATRSQSHELDDSNRGQSSRPRSARQASGPPSDNHIERQIKLEKGKARKGPPKVNQGDHSILFALL